MPTLDTHRSGAMLELLVTQGHNVACVGPTGTGKTLTVVAKLTRGLPAKFIADCLCFSARTSANQTQARRGGAQYALGRSQRSPGRPERLPARPRGLGAGPRRFPESLQGSPGTGTLPANCCLRPAGRDRLEAGPAPEGRVRATAEQAPAAVHRRLQHARLGGVRCAAPHRAGAPVAGLPG